LLDKFINKKERILLGKLNERGRAIFNERKRRKRGWTYIGESGSSVIDYVIANDKTREEVEKMTEEDRTESDHTSLEIELTGPKGISRRKEKKTKIEIERSD